MLQADQVYAWPSHLVFFENVLSRECIGTGGTVGDLFQQKGYVEKARFYNTPFPISPGHAGDVILLKHPGASV